MAKYKLLRSHSDLSASEWLDYETHTARECATEFGLEFKQALVTALAREHCKNAGHGGARTGAGYFNEENREVNALRKAIRDAKTVSRLNILPDSDEITPENIQQKRLETSNTIRATIAALKQILAGLCIAGILYLFYPLFENGYLHAPIKNEKMKKLNEKEIQARISMYNEAINSLFCYESADEEERAHEEIQKLVVIRQLEALKKRFIISLPAPEHSA